MPRQITSRLDETDIDRIVSSIQNSRSAADARKRETLLRKIIQLSGAPVIRGDEAHFFFESPIEGVIRAVGDWNGWKSIDKLERLSNHSRFYHLRKRFPIDARLAYRLTLDGQHSILDPFNPYSEEEVFGTNSVIRMPAYHSEVLAELPRPDVPLGRVREFEVPNQKNSVGNNFTRNVSVYLPADVRQPAKLPILYVHDGVQTITVGKFIHILDNLFYSEPHIGKAIVVFVPPRERDKEYMLNESYASWIAHTLVPFVDAKLKLRPIYRGTLGSSLGGLLSAQLGFIYPKVFSHIAMQSPALWVQNEKIVRSFKSVQKLPLRFFIHTGTIHDALDGSRKMLRVLQEKGYPTIYRETNESHNWGNWRGTYADVVRWFGEE